MAIIEEPGKKSLDYESILESILHTIEEIRSNNKTPIRGEYKIDRHICKYPLHNNVLITITLNEQIIAWLDYGYYMNMENARPAIPTTYLKFFKDRGFYINSIRVLKEFRNKKYGTILMNECIKDIKLAHHNAILFVDAFDIHTNTSKQELNIQLKEWYKSFGFKAFPHSDYMILQNVKY